VRTGSGRAFCAGADIGGFAQDIQTRESDGQVAATRRRQPVAPFATVMRNLSKPSIAAINGYALGIGCTMTFLCDVRIAAEEAQLGLIFARVGLISELGSSYVLPRLIGASRAAEMMLTGKRYPAKECLDMGLVSQVVPGDKLMAKSREIADEMLQC